MKSSQKSSSVTPRSLPHPCGYRRAKGGPVPSRRWSRLLALASALAFACVPASDVQVPEVEPSSTLAPSDLLEGEPAPFAVVHSGPHGSTRSDPTVNLVFSRPLRELGPDADVPQGLSLEPAVEGSWQWVGAHGLSFVPEAGHLPRATQFRVSVPASVEALDGSQLGEAHSFAFQTPLPHVERAWPASWERSAKPSQPIVLDLSQPTRPGELEASFVARANGKQQPVSIALADDVREDAGSKLVVTPVRGWPLNSKIEFELRPGWTSAAGPLPAEKAFRSSFRTYGPLVVTVSCEHAPDGRCRPEGGMWLSTSNAVNARALARAVRVTGATIHVDPHWGENDRTHHLSLNPDLKPGRSVTVRLAPLVDVYGQRLARVKHGSQSNGGSQSYGARQRGVTLRVGDYRPSVRIGFSGDSLAFEQRQVQVLSTNAAYELVTAPLTAEQLSELHRMRSAERFSALKKYPTARRKRVGAGPKNQGQSNPVDVAQLVARKGTAAARRSSGPFAIGVRYVDERGEPSFEVRWGQRTDLGITAKMGRSQSHAWITRLSSGRPAAGARVSVLGSQETVVTDDEGLARLPAGQFLSGPAQREQAPGGDEDETGPALLQVALGDQVAYRASNDSISGWQIDVYTHFYGSATDVAFLFPERDLFRPGEELRVKGYLRRPVAGGLKILAGEALTLSLRDPSGEEVSQHPVTTTDYGSLSATLRFPAAAALGYWSATLLRGEQHLASTSLQVAEYRRSEFEVTVEPDRRELVAGQGVDVRVAGNYFFGGVMAGARAELTAYREDAVFTPPGFEQYVSDDSAFQRDQPYRSRSMHVLSREEKLSDMGVLKTQLRAQFDDSIGPERLVFEATVHDVSGQAQSGRTSVLVHPASYYLALARPDSYFVDAPGSIEPQASAVAPSGQRVAGRPVQLELLRLRWTQVQQKTGPRAGTMVSSLVRDHIDQCSFVSDARDRGCELSVPSSGHYLIRAKSRDAQGRLAVASRSVYALGAGQALWRDDAEKSTLTLQADRDVYEVGQSARLLVQSPFERARAWVTVEGDDVLRQWVVPVQGSAPVIEVPVDSKMSPNAYVSVHLLEDREALGDRAHSISQSYRFGYAELQVEKERHRLEVSVSADRKSYRPGDPVELSLRVRDSQGQGRRSEVTLFVVDEGVLAQSGFQLPSPLDALLRSRPLRVETIEGRQAIARLFGLQPDEHAKKGEPGGGGEGSRSNFLTTAYFNPRVLTDETGRASVHFELPDNLGRFRVMALAVTKSDQYGKGQGALTVNKPLMVRPALPRFLRAGDEFSVSAVVSALGDVEGPVSVGVAGQGVNWLGERKAVVDLERGGSSLVSFAARAPSAGSISLGFSARTGSGSAKDAVRVTREVQSPAQIETVAIYGSTKTAEAHRLGDLSTLRRDLGSLDVTLASSALVGLEGGFEQMWDYPYLCSEQLASRVLPLVTLRDLAALYGVDVPQDADARVGKNSALLMRRQMGSGGFGMWPESREPHPWVSSYALWVLAEARQRGLHVSDGVFERGKRYLESIAAQREQEKLPEAVFATFALGRIGEPDASAVNALFDQLAEMPSFSRFLLLWAAAEAKVESVKQPLLDQVSGAITLRGNRAEITLPQDERWSRYMASRTRRHALALRALLAADPEHPLAAPLVRGLLDARRGGRWGSTQESAFALLALDAYQKAQEQEEPRFSARVFFGKELLGERRFAGRSTQAEEFSVAMGKLKPGGDVVFQQQGTGKLFYEARLRYARTHLPDTSLQRGFMVSKRVQPVSREQLTSGLIEGADVSQVEHGDLVLVDVVVLSPSKRRFVVVDDPLPAGLEAIDFSLQTSAGSLDLAQSNSGYSHAWHRQELRDDRVLYFVDEMPAGIYRYRYLARATTRGSFVVPPTRAMEMYQKEVFGRTAARQFEVN